MRTDKDRKRIRKQTRRRKIRHLRRRLEEATNPADRQRLIAKIKRVSPTAPVPDR